MRKNKLKKGAMAVSVPKIKKMKMDHLNRQIPPLAHTSMYLWHKYWSRKTWNVVGEFIKTYCLEDGIVFDPFAGSGITGMEALKNGRRTIVCDLNPIATEIIRLTVKPVKEHHFYEAYQRVEKKVKNKIENLYRTKCRKCGKEIIFDCSIWKAGKCIEIRYQKCPYCKDKREIDCKPNKEDKSLLDKINKKKIKEWFPENRLYYPDGRPLKKKVKKLTGIF